MDLYDIPFVVFICVGISGSSFYLCEWKNGLMFVCCNIN